MRKQHAKNKAKQIDMILAIAAVMAGVLGVIVLDDMSVLLIALLLAPVLYFKRSYYF